MRKDALAITVSSLVMGVFGAFLRWLQNRTIFEEDTGLALRGAPISVIYVIYGFLAAAAMLAFVLFWLRRCEKPREAAAALHTDSPLPGLVSWVCCGVFALGGLMLMFSSAAANTATLLRLRRILGAGAILAGACFPFLTSRREGEAHPLGRLTGAVSALFFCFWLLYTYLSNAQNPVRWVYGPEILALAATTLAFYHVMSWHYNSARPDAGAFFLQLAVFLDLCILPDSRSLSLTALFAAAAVMLLVLEYTVLSNMRRKE